MSIRDVNLNQFFEHLAKYKKLRYDNKNDEESYEESELAASTLNYAKDLTENILEDIDEIILNPQSQNEYENKLEEYISSKSFRVQVGKTLIAHPELKNLTKKYKEEQIFANLDKIFGLPVNEEFKQLKPTQINPILTLLTRIILAKPLIKEKIGEDFKSNFFTQNPHEAYDQFNDDTENSIESNNESEIGEDNLEDFIDSQIEEAISNLGYPGLTELQKQLKECDRDDAERLNDYLWQINSYNIRDLNKDNLNIDLFLDIFNHELEKRKKEDLNFKTNLELSAEILSKVDLEPDVDFIEKLAQEIEVSKKSRLVALLTVLANTKIKERTDSTDQITEKMVKMFIRSSKNKNKLLASQFLINNSQLASPQSIEALVKTLQIPKSKNLDTCFCALVILDSWTKNPQLKNQIQKELIKQIKNILNQANIEIDNDLSVLLSALVPLLDGPQALLDIYQECQNNIDFDNCQYIAASLLRFNGAAASLSQIKNDEGFLNKAIQEVTKITNGDFPAGESLLKLNHILGLANSSIENLLKLNIKQGCFSFGTFWKVMNEPQALEQLQKYLQSNTLTTKEAEILINLMGSRVVDIDQYASSGRINDGELTTLVTKFAKTPKDTEIKETIDKLLESYKLLCNENSQNSFDETFEDSLTRSFAGMGAKAEKHLLNIIKEAETSTDSIKENQAKLAEDALKYNSFLPELAA